MNIYPESFIVGDRVLVGQNRARRQLTSVLKSDRLSHAYLLTGPRGVGKLATALAFAEAIQGIDHLGNFQGQAFSKKSSWINHPDIRVFIPRPTTGTQEEMMERIKMLADDPYAVVDFGANPGEKSVAKNRAAFYPIDYYREEIKPATMLRPNEGRRNIVIISNIEAMQAKASNAFLKTLEEPGEGMMFILTTDRVDTLLPTITSRCQLINLTPLTENEIKQGLIHNDGLDEETATYLARISGGNYSSIRYFDVSSLREIRDQVVDYLRASYTLDAVKIVKCADNWASNQNKDGLINLLSILQAIIRDILLYRSTKNETLITNIDQLEVIKKFVSALSEARLEEMITLIEEMRLCVAQNISPKLVFTSLAIRYSQLMRGLQPKFAGSESWRQLPAVMPDS